MSKKSKFTAAAAIVTLSLSSQAFASTCSDQIARLQQGAPGGVTGLLWFSGCFLPRLFDELPRS
jgi:hypothetical protein